jgi:hypothetical protein
MTVCVFLQVYDDCARIRRGTLVIPSLKTSFVKYPINDVWLRESSVAELELNCLLEPEPKLRIAAPAPFYLP